MLSRQSPFICPTMLCHGKNITIVKFWVLWLLKETSTFRNQTSKFFFNMLCCQILRVFSSMLYDWKHTSILELWGLWLLKETPPPLHIHASKVLSNMWGPQVPPLCSSMLCTRTKYNSCKVLSVVSTQGNSFNTYHLCIQSWLKDVWPPCSSGICCNALQPQKTRNSKALSVALMEETPQLLCIRAP